MDLSAIVDGLPDDLNSGLTKKEKKTVLKSERRFVEDRGVEWTLMRLKNEFLYKKC